MTVQFIKNAGLVLSGDVENPILEADSIIIKDGLIDEVGRGLAAPADAQVIDANGCAVTPGLIDSHCHVVLGDYTPRQQMMGFLDSILHGGVTSVISAGEVHLQGRPKDPAGTKALAILAAKAWANYRPGGMKVLGGSVILEKGLTEADFDEMAREGVKVGRRDRTGFGQRSPGSLGYVRMGQGQGHGRHDAFRRHVHSGIVRGGGRSDHGDETERDFPYQWRPHGHER